MAVMSRRPWWLTWAFVGALFAIFIGERELSHIEWLHKILTILGTVATLSIGVWRLRGFTQAEGDRRRGARLLCLATWGCVLALGGYVASTPTGMGWLGVHLADKALVRYQGAMGVLWPILMVISLVPLLFAEWAEGAGRGAAMDAEGNVESFRVVEAASSGLSIALAAASLFLFCFVASERDAKLDVSYFKTATPGSATKNIVLGYHDPLKVLLFFDDVSEVKDEIYGYFDELRKATSRVEIEMHDRLTEAKLAKELKVQRDGAIVLKRGGHTESLIMDTEIDVARPRLRNFDEELQGVLAKLSKAEHIAYLTVGHDELNDTREIDKNPEGPSTAGALQAYLMRLNYKVKPLGLSHGLSQDVPDDASVVFVLGPKRPFLPEELAALDRYLERGGAMFIGLDPLGESDLGPLEARLGVHYDKTAVADDKVFYPFRHNAGDHRWIISVQFSTHPSLMQLSQIRAGQGILLINSGSLSDAPNAQKGENTAKHTFVAKSMSSAFSDKDDNNELSGDEKRQVHNLIAAVEGPVPKEDPKAKDAKPKGTDDKPHGMRAVVFSDVDLFGDFVLNASQLNRVLVADTVNWLVGEEKMSGETLSEKDVPIEHTKNKDVAWFYSTIIGAPALVLTGGLLGVFWRRRRSGRK